MLGGNDLAFQTQVFPACPVEITARYRWDGNWLKAVDKQYELAARQELLEFCGPNLDHAFRVWGLDPVLQLMEPDLAARQRTLQAPIPRGTKGQMALAAGHLSCTRRGF